MADDIRMRIAVRIVETNKRLAAFDAAERDRRKEAAEARKKISTQVAELEKMYESGAIQEDMFDGGE